MQRLYIGTKFIKAEPMTHTKFLEKTNRPLKGVGPRETEEGYLVIYPNGYKSWSPKHVFEAAYRLITIDEFDLVRSYKEGLK